MSILVQSKGRSQFIIHSLYKQAPPVPLTLELCLGVTLFPSWNPYQCRILAVHGQGHSIWAAERTSQHWLNNSRLWPTPHCPPECSRPWSLSHWPSMEHPHRVVTAGSMQEGTSRHHRAQATFGSTVLMKSQLIYFYCSLYTCSVFLYINYSSLPSWKSYYLTA